MHQRKPPSPHTNSYLDHASDFLLQRAELELEKEMKEGLAQSMQPLLQMIGGNGENSLQEQAQVMLDAMLVPMKEVLKTSVAATAEAMKDKVTYMDSDRYV
jgi:hypothetical protein